MLDPGKDIQFVINFFLRPKSDKPFRTILILKESKHYVSKISFKLLTSRSCLKLVKRGSLFLKIKLEDRSFVSFIEGFSRIYRGTQGLHKKYNNHFKHYFGYMVLLVLYTLMIFCLLEKMMRISDIMSCVLLIRPGSPYILRNRFFKGLPLLSIWVINYFYVYFKIRYKSQLKN